MITFDEKIDLRRWIINLAMLFKMDWMGKRREEQRTFRMTKERKCSFY